MYENLGIHLRRVCLGASYVVILFLTVDDYLLDGSYFLFVDGGGYFFLNLHYAVKTFLLDLLGH